MRVGLLMKRARQSAAVLAATLALAVHAQAPAPKPLPTELTDAIRFTISEVRVEGNSLVPAEALQESVKPFLGTGKRLEDLIGARRAIVESYRSKGFELLSVDYDSRRSREGIHFFLVREVRIGKVRVTGNQAISETEIRRQLPSLREGESPSLGRIARELFLLNDNPARNAGLEYSAGAPGTTDVEIKVAEQPQLRTAATYNNSGTSGTGTSRLGLYATHANLFGRSHQLTANLTTSDRPSRLLQVGLGYVVPLPAWGDSLSFNASYSDVDSGRIADLFNIAGKSSIWGAHYQHNLLRDAASRHVLDIGYDERRFRDLVDFFGVNLGASVTAKPLSLGYRYSGNSPGNALSLGATVQQNLPGGMSNDNASYAAARAGADARWQSWQFDVNWQHDLGAGWLAEARFSGQHANEPLIAAEQYGLGGARAVRGFRERDGAGDRGSRASLELLGPRFAESQRLLAFLDAGRSQRLNALPGELAREGVSSVGLGWRAQFKNGLQMSADYACVLNGTVRSPKGDQMLHFSATWWF